MKRFAARMLAFVLILSLMGAAALPITASAAISYNGVCGEKAMWYLDGSLLTVTGTGPMTNFDPEIGGPLYAQRETITAIMIEDGITTIGGNAFSNCSKLTGVEIPGSVTSIGYQAFMGCSSLMSIRIPASITAIGQFAFDWCSNLKTVFYEGTAAQKSSIAIEQGSDVLKNAAWHYDVTKIPFGDGYLYDCSCCDVFYYPSGAAAGGIYAVTFQYADGTVISRRAYSYGDSVAAPTSPAATEGQIFLGWDKAVTNCQGTAVYTAVFGQQAVPVAKVGDTSYPTLQAALDAAKAQFDGTNMVTVKLTGDLNTGAIVVIPKGVILDIETNTLEVAALIGVEGSMLIGGAPNSQGAGMGILKVAKENLILAEQGYTRSDGYTVLPVWNADHYEFCLFQMFMNESDSQGLFVDEANKSIKFVFRHVNSTYYRTHLLSDGAADNGIRVILELSWKVRSGDGEILGTPFQNFVYTEKLFRDILGGGMNYTFNLTGYDAMMLDPNEMEVTAKVVSDTGVCAILGPLDISYDKLN